MGHLLSIDQYGQAKKALDIIIGVVGVFLAIFVLSNLVRDFRSIATIENLHAFLLPPLLTLTFIPFMYCLALLFAYESLFVRMGIFLRKDEKALWFAKRKILLLCNFNLRKLNRFASENHREIMQLRDRDDVMNLIRKLERSRTINWGYVRRWYLRIGAILIAVLLMAFLLNSYSFPWTGFGDFETPTGEFVRGKTLWDWMELALIPLVLSLGALYFSNVQRRTELERAKRSEQADILQNYFDRMQGLILDRGLLEAETASPVTTMAMMLTRTTFDRLEPEQKTRALQFLDGTGLTTATHSEDLKISLTGISLDGVGLPTSYANGSFFGADFRFANMTGARFDMADFRGADFMGTHLENTKMMYCDFSAANLEGAFLKGANLFGSKFSDQTIMPNGKKWHEDVNWDKLGVVFEDPYTDKEYREALEELDYEV